MDSCGELIDIVSGEVQGQDGVGGGKWDHLFTQPP